MIYKVQQGKKLTDAQRNWNIAKHYLKSGPNIKNIWNALKYILDGPSKYQTGQPEILPGFQVKSLTTSGKLINQLSKKGTIGANNVRAAATSNFEKEILDKVLETKYPGQKVIDFADLQRAVQSNLIPYKTKAQTAYANYGTNRIGINPTEFKFNPQTRTFEPAVKLNTFTFEADKIPLGNAKHYDSTTLGHTRTFTTQSEPNVLHVMESQSDWAQNPVSVKSYNKGTKSSKHHINQLRKQIEQMKEIKYPQEQIDENEQRILKQKQYQEVPAWHIKYLQDNYLSRQLQENMLYASKHGQTVMRYPTGETVARIEGYMPYLTFNGNINKEMQAVNLTQQIQNIEMQLAAGTNMRNYQNLSRQLDQLRKQYNLLRQEASGSIYNPDEETIINKYDKFPKMYNKLFKDQPVKTIVDQQGNGWFEINIPKDLQNMQLQYKKGGILKGQEGLVFLDNGYQAYKDYNNLSVINKFKRNYNVAKHQLNSGNLGKAAYALIGGYAPTNSRQNTGEPPGIGIKNFGKLVRTARVAREFANVLSKTPKAKEFVMPGLIGWAPKTKIKGYHASNDKTFIPNFFHKGWAQKTHNAPAGIYIANGKAPGYGFLTKRPYVHQVETTLEKPQVQLGEVKSKTKNKIRNQIERDAQSQGADGIIYKGITDNQMPNQFITKTLNPDVKVNTNKPIDKTRSEVMIADDLGVYERPFKLYFEDKVNSLPSNLVDKTPIPEAELSYKQEAYDRMDFTPKYRMSIGKINEAWGQEILRRLRNLGYNTEQNGKYIIGQHKVMTNPEQYVKLNSRNKVTLGYFNQDNAKNGGFYGGFWNEAAIDPTHIKSIPSGLLHERVMHGTDKMLEGIQYHQGGQAQQMYQDFIDKIFFNDKGNLKLGFKQSPDGSISFNGIKVDKDDINWKEARATIAELARKLYVNVKGDSKISSIQDLERLRPAFEKEVNENPNLLKLLKDINGYGYTYSTVGPQTNPTFVHDLRTLLKIGPAALPFIITEKEEKE